MGASRKYNSAELDQAVGQVITGGKVLTVSRLTGIPRKPLDDHVKIERSGTRQDSRRPGPTPRLPREAESSILIGSNHGSRLSNRVGQAISKVRDVVDDADVELLFDTITKVMNDNKIDASRVFKVNETAFQSRKKTKSVVAARGSSNVWITEITTAIHMSIVACGSASGFVIPPLFILAGKTVGFTILDTDKSRSAVTLTESGFMNNRLFIKWLKKSESVSATISRPLLLIIDGCTSHYSVEVGDVAGELGIKLVCLPANATHLLQPLDVARLISLNLLGETAIFCEHYGRVQGLWSDLTFASENEGLVGRVQAKWRSKGVEAPYLDTVEAVVQDRIFFSPQPAGQANADKFWQRNFSDNEDEVDPQDEVEIMQRSVRDMQREVCAALGSILLKRALMSYNVS
ncbi:unnamed protein product [Phytophthora fragariaefolia]|uniref:Unnamed protein product n=1 Tax=Phytophthora fragariaefolia TaxID=1490495 RepID=A0A9W6XW09_9STRA|nr:unnamed protein product [Phytophthora fragariaefolia]